jgi:precorrin-3B synthase
MSVAVAIDVKGWCPGVLQPMQSGDGLIARVRPWCGAFRLDEASGLAAAAARFGNGHIDLTRRGNMQIRGVSEESLPGLRGALDELDLLDRDPRTEAGRNVMVGPLAGLDPSESLDVRPVARTLVRLLASDAALHDLPSKFGFLVDGRGTVSIAGERADISLCASGSEMTMGLDTPAGTQWLGLVSPVAAAAAAVAAARAFVVVARDRQRVRDLSDEAFARLQSAVIPMLRSLSTPSPAGGGGPQGWRGTRSFNTASVDVTITESPSALRAPPPAGEEIPKRPLGVLDLGSGRIAVGVAAPFGRLEASQLRSLVDVVRDSGATEIRLSPWRALYAEARDGTVACAIVEAVGALGLVVDSDDPMLRIEACPGAPACRSSSVDTRRAARQLAARGFKGSIHVSGCAKGCARSRPADLVLVGEDGRYNVIHDATARDTAERTIGAEELESLFDA